MVSNAVDKIIKRKNGKVALAMVHIPDHLGGCTQVKQIHQFNLLITTSHTAHGRIS